MAMRYVRGSKPQRSFASYHENSSSERARTMGTRLGSLPTSSAACTSGPASTRRRTVTHWLMPGSAGDRNASVSSLKKRCSIFYGSSTMSDSYGRKSYVKRYSRPSHSSCSACISGAPISSGPPPSGSES